MRYAYDRNGRLTNRWTLQKLDTAFRYDPIGNLTNVDYPGSILDVWLKYDPYNRLTNVVDGVGTTTFAWTAGDQLVSEDGPWTADTVTYGYQNRGRSMLSVAQPNASAWVQSYGYDELARLTNVISPAGTFGSQYSAMAAGLVARVNLPGGSAIHNAQDGLGRLLSTALVTAQQATNNLHAYGYNYGNQRTNQTFKAGNHLDYTFDNIGQLKTAFGKEAGGSSRAQEQFGYAYDGSWNLNWRTNNQLKQQFQVDNLNQLSSGSRSGTLTVAGSVSIPSSSVTVVGTGLSSGSATVYSDGAWAINGANVANGLNNYTSTATSGSRIAQDTVSMTLPATPTFQYDRNGNLTNDGVRTLEYDFENQLTNVFVANAWRSQFSYDGFGRRRVRKEFTWQGTWVPTNEVRYVYDGMLVLQERDGNNLPLATYTRGNDLSGSLQGAGGIGGLLARTENGLWLGGSPQPHAYYHADGNGNITCMVNASNAVVARYTYDPYGNLMAKGGPLAEVNLYRFSSKEYHVNSGLYYYGYRFYDAGLQRWVNPDPLGVGGGVNLYGFAGNSPGNFVDPDGLLFGDFFAWLGGEAYDKAMSHPGDGGFDPNGNLYQRTQELGTGDEGQIVRESCKEATGALGDTASDAAVGYGVGKVMSAACKLMNPAKKLKNLFDKFRKAKSAAETEGKAFTQAQKREILNANRARNEGKLRSDLSGEELVPSQKSQKGVTPAPNEVQVDHIFPRSQGGQDTLDNAQVLSRRENRLKSDKLP